MTSHPTLMAKWTAILDAGLDYGNEDHLRMVGTTHTHSEVSKARVYPDMVE